MSRHGEELRQITRRVLASIAQERRIEAKRLEIRSQRHAMASEARRGNDFDARRQAVWKLRASAGA